MKIFNVKSNVELKNVKFFKGNDGESLLKGSIYLSGKKVGAFSDDNNGGETEYSFVSEAKEAEVKQAMIEFLAVVGFFKPREEGSLVKIDEKEEFIDFMCEIKEYLKVLKASQKKQLNHFEKAVIKDGKKFEGDIKKFAFTRTANCVLAFSMSIIEEEGSLTHDFDTKHSKFCYSAKELETFSKTVPANKNMVWLNGNGEFFIVA